MSVLGFISKFLPDSLERKEIIRNSDGVIVVLPVVDVIVVAAAVDLNCRLDVFVILAENEVETMLPVEVRICVVIAPFKVGVMVVVRFEVTIDPFEVGVATSDEMNSTLAVTEV